MTVTAPATPIPDPQQRRQIASLACMPEKTVWKVYQDPEGRKPSTVARVQRAAAELGFPVPRPPESIL